MHADHPSAEASTAHAMRGGTAIAVAMGVMNLCTYGYTIVAARVLGPGTYGAFAALMGLLIVVMVASLALQATAARRIASTPGHVHQIEREIMRLGVHASIGVGLACLVLSPVINLALRLDSLATAAFTALAAAPLTLMGAQAGILQGERRWGALALIYVSLGVPRLVLGTALILWRPTAFLALLGVVIGAYVPVLVGWLALRRSREPGEESAEHSSRELWKETLHNSNALLAFFALSNVDILVARNVLDEHQAGLYAGGLIMVKAVLFLPQFVVVLAFPSMSSGGTERATLNKSLVVVAGLGAVAAVGTAVLSGLAVMFVGGAQYAAIQDELWVFALLGTALSLLQLLVYNVLARQARRAVLLLWLALVAVVVLGQMAGSVETLLVTVLLVNSTLLALLLVLGRTPKGAARDAEEVELSPPLTQ